MIIKNPIVFWLLSIFTLVNVLDIITALFILPAEANPLFLLTGSIYIAILIKVLVVVYIVYSCLRNIYVSHTIYFMFIMILVLGSLLISFGVYSNIDAMLNPNLLVDIKGITTSEKISAYFMFTNLFYTIPMIISLLSFKLYHLSLKYNPINSEYFRSRKWWQP